MDNSKFISSLPQIIQTLNNIETYLNEIPYLNNGGCGLVAYLTAIELYKRNIPYNYLVYNIYLHNLEDYKKYTYVKKLNKKKQLKENTITASHVAIRVGNQIFNKCDIWRGNFYVIPRYLSSLITDNLQVSYKCKDFDFWNTMFDKEKYEPRIKRIIKVHFMELDKQLSCDI